MSWIYGLCDFAVTLYQKGVIFARLKVTFTPGNTPEKEVDFVAYYAVFRDSCRNGIATHCKT